MNTIQHITRQDESLDVSQSLTIGTISSLTRTDHLDNDALFELSTHIDDSGRYLSKAVSWGVLCSKLSQQTQQYFDAFYATARYNTIGNIIASAFSLTDASQIKTNSTIANLLLKCKYDTVKALTYTQQPFVWGDVLALAVNALKLQDDIDDLNRRIGAIENMSLAYSGDSDFMTELSVFQTITGESVNATNGNNPKSLTYAYDHALTSGIDRGFVVALYARNKTSNIYTCQETGMLLLYGWLDTTNIGDKVYVPEAWCALEAKLGKTTTKEWEIIALSPVTPNKQLCYVGFNVPVIKNLQIRVRVGFTPGEASNRYSHTDVPESLSNRTANAFLGGIYTTSYLSTRDAESDVTTRESPVIQNIYNNITQEVDLTGYVTRNELIQYIPNDYYTKTKTYSKDQVRKALGYQVNKCDVIPEISAQTKEGVNHGNDDKPVNRLAVWNFVRKGEIPVGTVVMHAKRVKANQGELVALPDHPEWVYCNGVKLKASDYPELAKIMETKAKTISIPDLSNGPLSYFIKVRSSYDDCKVSGWSLDLLKSEGVDMDEKPQDSWETDLTLK